MLILSRRPGESLTIGDDVVVTVVGVSGNQIRLGITAPREVRVLRKEVFNAMREENQVTANGLDSNRRLEDAVKQPWRREKAGAGSSHTANCAVYQGETPVFAGIDPGTLLVDPADVEAKITPRMHHGGGLRGAALRLRHPSAACKASRCLLWSPMPVTSWAEATEGVLWVPWRTS